ncbi:spore protease YyaC [Brassicibacter mesophilus]|uniref:spore protease YyaC n=1 Tax=Brassicibacter mesophilus TaxID=745119 RepID=UPI003D1D8B4C
MSVFFETKSNSVNSNSPFAMSELSNIILEYLNDFYDTNYDDLLIVCIGTDRSTGDCLGPLIGYKLSSMLKLYPKVHVLGTLDDPVHAKNLKDKITHIYSTYNKPFIMAIDACLGKLERVGYINVSKGALKPGAGVNKELPEIGNIHITGVVNLGGFMEYIILQNTRLSIVMKMADTISSTIKISLWKYFREKALLNN